MINNYIEIYKPFDIRQEKDLIKRNIDIKYLGHDSWRLSCINNESLFYLKKNYKYYKIRFKQ